MTMGEQIRHYRQQAGLSQRQLCEGLITRNMLSQIENGSARPSLSTLQALAQRLGQPVQIFLADNQPAEARDLSQNDELLLSWAVAAIKKQQLERAGHLLSAVESPGSPHWHFAKGCLLCAQGDYAAAAAHLRKGESYAPAAAWKQLEICCRETGDYKGAYEYACKLREQE